MAVAVAELLSIYDISKRIPYSPAAIHKAIERFGISPDRVTPSGFRYFSESIIPILKEKMRQPNGKKKS